MDSKDKLKKRHDSQVFLAVNGYLSESGELHSQHGVSKQQRQTLLPYDVSSHLVNWRVPLVIIRF